MSSERWPGSDERWARFVAWKRDTFDRGVGPRGTDTPRRPDHLGLGDLRWTVGDKTPYGIIIEIERTFGTHNVGRALCRAFDQGVAAGDWTLPIADLSKPPIERGVFREGVIHWHDCPVCQVSGGELCRHGCTHEPDRDDDDRMHGAIIACSSCRALLDKIRREAPGLDPEERHEIATTTLGHLQNDHKVALVYVYARGIACSDVVNLLALKPEYFWTPEFLVLMSGPLSGVRLSELGRVAVAVLRHHVNKRPLAEREIADLRHLGAGEITGLSAGAAGLFLRGLVDVGAQEDGRPLVLLNVHGRAELAKLGPAP